MNYSELITSDPLRRRGKPCVRDLNIAVSDVLRYLGDGRKSEDIFEFFRI
jgi:uncharacterized protein (DUF433 family)